MFNLFNRNNIVIGSCVVSSDNKYGKSIQCQVSRIYHRGRSKLKYCRLNFILNGLFKTINVNFKSCKIYLGE